MSGGGAAMPIHDWTKVRANRFHHFHQEWVMAIARRMNKGVLPKGYFALAEQRTPSRSPDVVTLLLPRRSAIDMPGGVSVLERPVKTMMRAESDMTKYAEKATSLTVRHPDGGVVALIEVVSPGNKHSRESIKQLVGKVMGYIRKGRHVLLVDLFPPTNRDPNGIHGVIWRRIEDDHFRLPAEKPLTAVSYEVDLVTTAYIEPLSVGEVLPEMPIFIAPEHYVNVPLEAAYLDAWAAFPDALKHEDDLRVGDPA
jgi:hypothetical protein